ncbi:MAG: T9SS type A sorting domain-containing protein [Candidatus Aegiribacteria sp.]|nr:T9SS type A sorting domain-containing protein [Candidatus Aegiribacteria sp.]
MGGGGVMVKGDGNIILNNNTIVYNLAHLTGGGICTFGDGGVATFSGVNNIIVFNTADDGTQYGSTHGGGTSSLTYSCISQDMPGIGNINDTPMFVNATIDDYHLQFGSPCIDAGDPASPPDPDGTRADMGALYYNQTGIGGAVNPSSAFEMYPASPNPFSSVVDISCSLPDDGNLRIIVYDIMGREVFTLIDQFSTSGIHSVMWDGRNSSGERVESGVYFCRCEFDGAAQSKQLILIED